MHGAGRNSDSMYINQEWEPERDVVVKVLKDGKATIEEVSPPGRIILAVDCKGSNDWEEESIRTESGMERNTFPEKYDAGSAPSKILAADGVEGDSPFSLEPTVRACDRVASKRIYSPVSSCFIATSQDVRLADRLLHQQQGRKGDASSTGMGERNTISRSISNSDSSRGKEEQHRYG